MQFDLNRWQLQQVRDLAWVMASPSLLLNDGSVYSGERVGNDWCERMFQQNLDWLDELDRQATPLIAWLFNYQSHLLGRYFEGLVSFWLNHLAQTDVIASNVVVCDGSETLGEFDLLFRDSERNQVIHWEMAVKYYLAHPDEDGELKWFGPNAKDRLDLKLSKVFDRQLKLSEAAAAKALLSERYGLGSVYPAAFIKGYLFYPAQEKWRKPKVIPDGVSADHLRGWWCYVAEAEAAIPKSSKKSRWRALGRLEWLSPALGDDKDELMKWPQLLEYLKEYFDQNQKPLLLSEMAKIDGHWLEVSRGFVVPPHWPSISN